MPRRTGFALLATLALAACAREDIRPYTINRSANLWTNVALAPDRSRLAGLADAWTLAQADLSADEQAQFAALGAIAARPVADANAPQQPVTLPPGQYHCRTIRLGRRRDAPPQSPALVVEAAAPCVVNAGPVPVLATNGTQRLSGGLYQDRGRLVLLGSLALGDERGWRPYGQDAMRSQIGAMTAIGPGQWRLALPWPRWQNKLWLVEISAAP
ncbi:MAG: DUF4893 domain-containing protein [Sphingomonadales bacterium]